MEIVRELRYSLDIDEKLNSVRAKQYQISFEVQQKWNQFFMKWSVVERHKLNTPFVSMFKFVWKLFTAESNALNLWFKMSFFRKKKHNRNVFLEQCTRSTDIDVIKEKTNFLERTINFKI